MKRAFMIVLVGSILLATPFLARQSWAQPAETLAPLAQLELTPQQEAKMTQIRLQIRRQIEQVLSPEQIRQFKAAIAQGMGIRKAIASTNLTAEQTHQIRQIFQTARTDVGNILTASQKQQIRKQFAARLMEWTR